MLTASSFRVWGICVRPPAQDVVFAGDRRTTYGGWKKSAPVHRWFIPLFPGFLPSQVVQDFFHPQYQLHSTTVLCGKSKQWTACCCLQKSRRTRYHIIIPSFMFYGTVAGISRIFLWLLKDGDQDLRANHDSLIGVFKKDLEDIGLPGLCMRPEHAFPWMFIPHNFVWGFCF